ncbi:MAG: DUF3179 domain-containing (seleno)protein [Sphingomonadales bacterium]
MMNLILENWDLILYGVGLAVVLLIFMPFSPMLIDVLMLPRGIQIGIFRYRYILWAVVWACCLTLLARGLNVAEPAGWPAPLVGFLKGLLGDWGPAFFGQAADPVWLSITVITVLVMAMMFWSGYVPYVMTPPKKSDIVGIEDADKILSDDEMILGVVNGDEVRAYSRDAISRPHFFNDTVGDERLMISYCILCNSAMAFKTELGGKPMDLKCVTAYNNNIIYYDPDSGNYIQQMDGAVFHGPDKGAALEGHPVVQSTWGQWKQLHPDTKYFHAPSSSLRDKMVDKMLQMMIPISSLSRRKKPWHRIRGKLDTRLGAMSLVYAVEHGDDHATYAEAELKKDPVINDSVGGKPIVVLYNAELNIGAVYSRNVEGKDLTFEAATGDGGAVVTDRETGSLWDVNGNAVSGELAGKSLDAVPHFNKLFWFSWPLFKDQTRVGPA